MNALRTSHNPPAPELLDIADRLGFLVMDEAFDCWDQAKNTYDYARFFSQWATTDIGDMVARDRNHPSIIIWSIGNEIQDNNNTTIAASLIAAVKAKDSTRAIGQANASAAPGAAVAALEDVVGLNYAPYSYDSHALEQPELEALRQRVVVRRPQPRRLQDAGHDEHPAPAATTSARRTTTASSPGAPARRARGPASTRAPSSPASSSGPASTTSASRRPTAGRRRARTSAPSTPRASRRTSSTSIRASGAPPGRRWSTSCRWTGPAGRPAQSVTVCVYSNADSVELFLNGTSLGSKTTQPRTTGHLQWSVTFATGTLQAKATKGGTVVATDTVQDGRHGGEAGARARPRVDHGGRARPVLRRGGHRRRAGRRRPQGRQHHQRRGQRSGHAGRPRRRRLDEPRLLQGDVPRRLQRQADGDHPIHRHAPAP